MPSSGLKTSALDRKSTRLNSSHTIISYAVFCLKKKMNRAPVVSVTTGSALDLGSLEYLSRCVCRLVLALSCAASARNLRCLLFFFFFLNNGGPPEFPLFPHPPPFRS